MLRRFIVSISLALFLVGTVAPQPRLQANGGMLPYLASFGAGATIALSYLAIMCTWIGDPTSWHCRHYQDWQNTVGYRMRFSVGQ